MKLVGLTKSPIFFIIAVIIIVLVPLYSYFVLQRDIVSEYINNFGTTHSINYYSSEFDELSNALETGLLSNDDKRHHYDTVISQYIDQHKFINEKTSAQYKLLDRKLIDILIVAFIRNHEFSGVPRSVQGQFISNELTLLYYYLDVNELESGLSFMNENVAKSDEFRNTVLLECKTALEDRKKKQ